MGLELLTFPGAPDGMGRYAPQHLLKDTEAWTILDALLDIPGYIRRRGPLEEAGTGHTTNRTIGLACTMDPTGMHRVIKLVKSSSSSTTLWKGLFNSTLSEEDSYGSTPNTGTDYELFDAKDALGGGVMIGRSHGYDASGTPTMSVQLWKGAYKDRAFSDLAVNLNRGNRTVTVDDGSTFSEGHFLYDFDSQAYIGCVKSISADVLTLEEPSLVSLTTGTVLIEGRVFKHLDARVSKGRITTSTTSAVVNGGGTKFKAMDLGNAAKTWDLFTVDKTYIGTIDTVASDVQLTLEANAAVSLLNSDYIAIERFGAAVESVAGTHRIGWMNASFAGHQFYADGDTILFSDDDDPEALDRTENGDKIKFSSDPIRALIPCVHALVSLTEKEAFALVGAVGTTPDKWRGEPIHDDGTICGMTAHHYKGGSIWAGKRGIWYWDGGNPVNIVGALGDDYRKFVSTATRAWAMIVKDHYFCYVEGGASGVFQKVKGAAVTNYTRLTFIVNLTTGAVSIATNLDIRASTHLPAMLGQGSALFGINTTAPASRTFKGDSLFLDDGNDAYTCEGNTVGPDFYLETKKYDLGDAQRLKLFKMLLLHHLSAGGNLKLDTVPGLGTTGTTSLSQFMATSSFADKRLKFMKRSQFLAVRIYQSDTSGPTPPGNPAAHTRITLGSWAIGFKWKRPGRV